MASNFLSRLKNNRKLLAIARKLPQTLKQLIYFTFDAKFRRYNSIVGVPRFYKEWVAPNLSFYVYWLGWPIVLILKYTKISFLVNNISNSPGHVSSELDYFLRSLHLGRLDASKRYVVIWPRSEVAHGAKAIYRGKFANFIVSDVLYAVTLPLTMRYPELRTDCSLSAVDESLLRCKKYGFNLLPLLRQEVRPFEEIWKRYFAYFLVRSQTSGLTPMKNCEPMSSELREFLGEAKNKYALIQIKTHAVNATATPTDPYSYVETIKYLMTEGIKIVFAGREAMPNQFKELGVLNYAESKIASFQHDLELVQNANFVLSSASGFGWLVDTMGIPLVYANQWSFACPAPGRYTVMVPALFRDSTGQPWSFKDQISYFYDRKDSVSPIPSSSNVRSASALEILKATKEAMDLGQSFKPKTVLQQNFQTVRKTAPLAVAESRVSQHFIEKFKCLME